MSQISEHIPCNCGGGPECNDPIPEDQSPDASDKITAVIGILAAIEHDSGIDTEHAIGMLREVRAELNQHHRQDDDEPVTEEWLRSIGPTTSVKDQIEFRFGEPMTRVLRIRPECGELYAYIRDCQSEAFLCKLGQSTRDQFRDLCRVLGIDLKEPE